MGFDGSKLKYSGLIESPLLKGNVTLSVSEDGLLIIQPFSQTFLSHACISSFVLQNYAVRISTDTGEYVISRLGNLCDAFYKELYDSYNEKVLKALFAEGALLLMAEGEYHYIENGAIFEGQAKIHIYEACICILPPNDCGRRIPFCFINDIKKESFKLTVTLVSGESYSFIRLGYNTEPFASCINIQLGKLRENAMDAIRLVDGSLKQMQLSAIADIMPEGVAAPLGKLQQVAPSYMIALERQISDSRAKDTYSFLKGTGNTSDLCIGMKSLLAGEQTENILWFMAPSKSKSFAFVEFALAEETSAATFVYKVNCDWEVFWRNSNRAMEAINFKREIIRLTDEELKNAENDIYAMAVQRTASLRFLRSCFVGRVIHSSIDSWKKGIAKYIN